MMIIKMFEYKLVSSLNFMLNIVVLLLFLFLETLELSWSTFKSIVPTRCILYA